MSDRVDEEEHIEVTPTEARQGFKGADILAVLAVSTFLAAIGLTTFFLTTIRLRTAGRRSRFKACTRPAEEALRTPALGARPRAHRDLARIDFLPALRTGHDRTKVVPARQVTVQHRRSLLARIVRIAPMHQRYQCRIEPAPFLRQAILVTRRPRLIGDLLKDALFDQKFEPRRQHAPRNTQALLKVVEAAHAQESLAQNQHRPAIANDRQRAC